MNKIEVRKHNNSTSIINTKYVKEVNCIGSEFFPDIGVEYNYLIWSDQPWIKSYYTDENNSIQEFSKKQLKYIEEKCKKWIQPLGQEGNPTLPQAQERKKLDLSNYDLNQKIAYTITYAYDYSRRSKTPIAPKTQNICVRLGKF